MDRRSFLATVAGVGAAVALPMESAGAATRRRPVYSNMAERATLDKARTLLRAAGISWKRVEVFAAHVRQFNAAVPRTALTRGYEDLWSAKPKYDPYDLQEIWSKTYPDFPGYNCRITAFGLFGAGFRLGRLTPSSVSPRSIFMDLEALEADPSMLMKRHELYRFKHLYSAVPTVASTEWRTQAAALQRDWKRRGIRFVDSPRARLINVVVHNKLDRDELFIGHTGVLLPTANGLWFVEKLAFQEPYRLVHVNDRHELNRYLMGLYDTDESGTAAATLIMENGSVMPGYRPLRTR